MPQVLKYHDGGMGSWHDGYPARSLTDEDLATLAYERGETVPKLMAKMLELKAGDGKPMYTETKAAEKLADAPKDQPKTPDKGT